MVVLLSSDNELFTADKDIVNHVRGIKIDNDNDKPIFIENVESYILKKVLEYCEYHRNDPLPSDEEQSNRSGKRQMCEWDTNFFAPMNRDMLFDVINAAYHLDIKLLLDASCLTVANRIRGMSTEQIREVFNVVNDFTPEEEEQLRKENEWAEIP
ncbi:ubiquitin-protein ligase [Cyathus striatus]|nr:ubiquitin-protein ligase [Cyathus striatus]